MKQYFDKFFSYLKSAHSEANGTGSANRWDTFMLVVAYILSGAPILFIPRLTVMLGIVWLSGLLTLIPLFAGLKVVKDINTRDSEAQALPGQKENAINQ